MITTVPPFRHVSCYSTSSKKPISIMLHFLFLFCIFWEFFPYHVSSWHFFLPIDHQVIAIAVPLFVLSHVRIFHFVAKEELMIFPFISNVCSHSIFSCSSSLVLLFFWWVAFFVLSCDDFSISLHSFILFLCDFSLYLSYSHEQISLLLPMAWL